MGAEVRVLGLEGPAAPHRESGPLLLPRPECASPGKHPRTPRGVHNASRRPEQLRRWWAAWPDASVAIATGALVVIDVDGKQGHESLVALQTEHGTGLPATPWVQTARRRHLYFLAPTRDIPNSSGRLGAGVDIRGTGGYVVAPPSRHASGGRYRWHGLQNDIRTLPDWLARALITPRTSPGPSPAAAVSVPDRYLRAALAGELERVVAGAAARRGTRNDTLNRAAFRLGQLATDHGDDTTVLTAQLLDAALATGLGEREARATINSGPQAGLKRPRSAKPLAANETGGPR